MSDINKWIGSGRVTRDTELRYTPNGTAVADLGLCCNRMWNKEGQRQEEATFVDITLWGKQAETLAQYLTKGTFVIVEGRLILDAWETPEGVKRSKLKVVADRINLGPKQGSNTKRDVEAELDDVVEEAQAPF